MTRIREEEEEEEVSRWVTMFGWVNHLGTEPGTLSPHFVVRLGVNRHIA